MKLKTVYPIQTLFYAEGHFFKPHRDDVKLDSGAEYKKVTVFMFLNSPSKTENTTSNKEEIFEYTGGNIKLHGLLIEFPEKALTVPSRKGLMVAFKSDVVHEVTTIEPGYRCSLAIWLV